MLEIQEAEAEAEAAVVHHQAFLGKLVLLEIIQATVMVARHQLVEPAPQAILEHPVPEVILAVLVLVLLTEMLETTEITALQVLMETLETSVMLDQAQQVVMVVHQEIQEPTVRQVPLVLPAPLVLLVLLVIKQSLEQLHFQVDQQAMLVQLVLQETLDQQAMLEMLVLLEMLVIQELME